MVLCSTSFCTGIVWVKKFCIVQESGFKVVLEVSGGMMDDIELFFVVVVQQL